ncbi:MAG: mechanosensitive ion channel family protein, partial [Clostridia bacterium]|nr:mechanosensitive ion channel family protein [Clostridia bacterium]
DFIESCGHSGVVQDIRITYTKILTPDNKMIYLPNGALSTSSIVNYSEMDLRRVDHTVSISYTADYKKAEETVLNVLRSHAKVLESPAPMVRIMRHGDSSIQLVVRAWVKSPDYWDVYFDLLEQIKSAFDENGIEIPYSQLDVHIKNS